MLSIDRSGSMAYLNQNPPEPFTTVKNAALSFVDNLESTDRAGVISFANTASAPIDQILTDDYAAVRDAINAISIGTNGVQNTNIADALQKSLDELTGKRHNAAAKQSIILLTDGVADYPQKKGDPQFAADRRFSVAHSAQSQGVNIYTIGLGKDVDSDFLKSVAGEDDRFYAAASSTDLAFIYYQIATSMCKLGPAKVEIITDVVPQ